MKLLSRFLEIAMFWVPFVFAAFLSFLVMRSPDSAWPAFYSFLPMTFFFVGAAFMVLVARVRRLERQVAVLAGTAESGQDGGGLHTLYNDPEGWSRAAVGTLPRFWFTAVSYAALPLLIVYAAVNGGWRGATVFALVLGFFQFNLLYALRRLLVNPGNAASSHGA
jgi:hypothetical protein